MTRESSNGKKMDLQRFAAIVDAYGAAEEAWPEDERRGALQLLATSKEAVHLREEAATLDSFLDSWSDALPAQEPSRSLRDRILEQAPQPARSWSERWSRAIEGLWPFGPSWQPAAALAAAAVLGVTFGLTLPEPQTDSTTVVAEVALDTGSEYWSESP